MQQRTRSIFECVMSAAGLTYLFIVQGEGRGHLTQAIALQRMLSAQGHHVAAVMVGKNDRRDLPRFFVEQIDAPVRRYRSPTFVVDRRRRGVRIGATIWKSLVRLPSYLKSLYLIQRYIRRTRPDVIVNFYEPLAGLSLSLMGVRGSRVVCIGHQYLLNHPEFEWPSGSFVDRSLLLMTNWLTARCAGERLALSFRPMTDLPGKSITVCPPLVRRKVIEAEPETEGFLLVYLLNDGYADDIIRWHETRPEVEVHAFWDRRGVDDVTRWRENLTFHRLCGAKFLDHMRRCRAFVSTAGFESICEAMYLGKPVMLVPTAGHFEQQCNAIDAVKAGAGMAAADFDIEAFLSFLETFAGEYGCFRSWVESAESRFLQCLTVRPAGKAGSRATSALSSGDPAIDRVCCGTRRV